MPMRRSTRMMLGKAAREARLPGRKMEIEYESWDEPEQRYIREPQSNWRERPYPLENRFRDRRGREHYDDGRFAPMGNGGRYGPYARDYDPFGEREEDADMRTIGFNSNWGGEMHGGADATVPRYTEMDRLPGNGTMRGGYMAGSMDYGKMDEQTAMVWARGMKNEDGSKTPHWSMEQVRQVMSQKNIDADLAEFFAIMNSLYSDFDPVFKRHNVSTMDFYIEMTKAWLKDKDAVPNKAMVYYECIVKK